MNTMQNQQTPINLGIVETKVNHKITLVADSRIIAKALEKEHKTLLRDIDTYIQYWTTPTESTENLNGTNLYPTIQPTDYFIESTYIAKNNKQNRYFLITQMGCEFLATRNTGQKGAVFAALYVKEFNRMRDILQQKETLEWKQDRQQGKIGRRDFTDTIKDFIKYALLKGESKEKTNAFYGRFTKIVNNCFGIVPIKGKSTRDYLDRRTLRKLEFFEIRAAEIIEQGISNDAPPYIFFPIVEAGLLNVLKEIGYNQPMPLYLRNKNQLPNSK